MERKKFSKKGQLGRTAQEEPVLMNENGVQYKVTDTVAVVWQKFENKTVGEVAEEVALLVNRNPEELREPIERPASQLKEAELLG